MVKDADLFAAAMADVKPLRVRKRAARLAAMPKKRASAPAAPAPRAKPTAEELAARLAAPRAQAPAAPTRPELSVEDRAFDRDVSRSLSRGKLVPQASLDLHGMTVAAAERAVTRFLEDAAARDLRVVLVVTGKGVRLEGGRVFGGRIRNEFVGWLNRADNRDRVRAVRPAHPRHGGGGAFYVLLRRRSSASSRSLRATPQR
ncbi:MAG: Smr/MutS family protein [Proteobacteria bacterium]|nr:Smr/MutS family protein [Pseudomonadota bacterium]